MNLMLLEAIFLIRFVLISYCFKMFLRDEIPKNFEQGICNREKQFAEWNHPLEGATISHVKVIWDKNKEERDACLYDGSL